MKTKFLRIITLFLLITSILGYIWIYTQTEDAFKQKQATIQTVQTNYIKRIINQLNKQIRNYIRYEKNFYQLINANALEPGTDNEWTRFLPASGPEGVIILDARQNLMYERGPGLDVDSLNFCLRTEASSEGVYTCPITQNTVLYSYIKTGWNRKEYNIIFYRTVNDSLAHELELISGYPARFVHLNKPVPAYRDYAVKTTILKGIDNKPLMILASYFPVAEREHLRTLQWIAIAIIIFQTLALGLTDTLASLAGFSARLHQKNIKIKQISAQRETLLRVLSHDLKNHITGIIIQCDLGLTDDKLPDSISKRLAKIRHSAIQQNNMIEKVRRNMALEGGRLHLQPERIPFDTIIRDISEVFGEQLKEKDIRLEIDNRLNGHKLYIDRQSFSQNVLNNIMSNAIKFSFPGQTIRIISKAAKKGFARIEILDKGIGIPPRLRNIIWEDSGKTHREGTAGETGTGFGMPLAKKFMEAQGGYIELESISREEDPDNHGTRVILHVPCN